MNVRQCLHELSDDLQPKRNTPNLDCSEKRCCVFSISCGDSTPLLQLEKSIFDKMSKLIEISVIESLLFAILLRRNHYNHSVFFCKFHNFVRVISTIGKKILRRNAFNQSHSFFAISSGTLCDKYSDRHTKRIHGKVNFGVEPPFVRAMSWFPPFAPEA